MIHPAVISPFIPYLDLMGKTLNGGQVFIGVAGMDPQTNPQAVYWDETLSTGASQPIAILGGYTMRSGSPARFYTDPETFSMRVRDAAGNQVFYEPNANPQDVFALFDFDIEAENYGSGSTTSIVVRQNCLTELLVQGGTGAGGAAATSPAPLDPVEPGGPGGHGAIQVWQVFNVPACTQTLVNGLGGAIGVNGIGNGDGFSGTDSYLEWPVSLTGSDPSGNGLRFIAGPGRGGNNGAGDHAGAPGVSGNCASNTPDQVPGSTTHLPTGSFAVTFNLAAGLGTQGVGLFGGLGPSYGDISSGGDGEGLTLPALAGIGAYALVIKVYLKVVV
jgi:hypothetical protein